MWNCQNFRASLCFKLRQRTPEIFWVLAVVLRERHRLIGNTGITPEDDIAVQVVTAPRCVLVSDQRGEHARLVVLIGECRVVAPSVPDDLACLQRLLFRGKRADDLHRRREHSVRIACLQCFVPLFSLGLLEQFRIAFLQRRHQSVHLGMVAQHHEVQGARQSRFQPMRCRDLLAACKAVGIFLADCAHRPCIDGDRRVQMGFAEKDACRKLSPRVG